MKTRPNSSRGAHLRGKDEDQPVATARELLAGEHPDLEYDRDAILLMVS